MENVTPRAFTVATKRQAIGNVPAERLCISYELNKGRAKYECEEDYNTTHIFYTIYVMCVSGPTATIAQISREAKQC